MSDDGLVNELADVAEAHFLPIVDAMAAVLKAYEQWEADIIFENKCWSGQNLQLTDDLYDRMIELQTMRNRALSLISHGRKPETT